MSKLTKAHIYRTEKRKSGRNGRSKKVLSTGNYGDIQSFCNYQVRTFLSCPFILLI